jgi:LysR family hydrogen peroxide-inducible transcriptional activator
VDRFAQPRPKRTIGVVWRKSNPLATQLMRISAVVRQASPREPASFAP